VRREALAVVLALAPASLAQVPTEGLSIRKEKASGAQAEFVSYPWRPDVFETMESGGVASEGQRSWAFARLATSSYFAVDGTIVPPGRYVLALTPRRGNLPMTLELRRGDGRALFADPTAMAAPPVGDTLLKLPAAFEVSPETVPALDLTLAGWRDGVTLTIRYGNRKLAMDLVRAAP
jgi:hypothetical protein